MLANETVFWTSPQSYYDTAKWRGTWELDGCAFMNQASHYTRSKMKSGFQISSGAYSYM